MNGDGMIRPGPTHIAPNGCPGGVVLHVYRAGDHRLLLTSELDPALGDDDLAERAAADAQLVAMRSSADDVIVFVYYDGDSGDRIRPEDVGMTTGQRLWG